MQTVKVIFWCSSVGIIYAYVIYPAVLHVLASLLGKQRVVSKIDDADLPRVALLIAAHNEESCIGERLVNAVSTDYPVDKLQIVVASDGSSDQTNAIVQERQKVDSRITLLAFEQRRGKSAMLNDALSRVTEEIVCLSDANTMYSPDAIRRLVAWFQDPRVSTVCGRLVLIAPEHGGNVDSLYWRYETFLKIREAKLGGLLGANGAIYAIRRDRFAPIPANTVIDDFVIPLLSRIKHGGEIVYDEGAVATEETPPEINDEFRRRVRIGAGAYQSLAILWPLLHPKHGWTTFTFLNHKLLRWMVPALLVAALAANIVLARDRLYLALLLVQVGFYTCAFIGPHLGGPGKVAKIARGASMFTAMNVALAVGFFRWLLTHQRGTWQRTNR